MWTEYLKCKIHRATVTDANLNYEGSISIGGELMEAAGLREFEKVEIYNVTNGERFATYVIHGAPAAICINGAAAWKAKTGDIIIIAAYQFLTADESYRVKPTLVYVDGENRAVRIEK